MTAGLAAEADIAADAVHEPVIATAGVGLLQANDIAGLDVRDIDLFDHPRSI